MLMAVGCAANMTKVKGEEDAKYKVRLLPSLPLQVPPHSAAVLERSAKVEKPRFSYFPTKKIRDNSLWVY